MILSVREAVKSDIPAMTEVVASAWKKAYKDLLTQRDIDAFTNAGYRSASFDECFLRGDFTYVLLCDEKVSAMCSVMDAGGAENARVCEINQLYVLPERQRIGFGRKLLWHTLRAMRGKGFKTAELYVLEGNTGAERFYEKLGFTKSSKRVQCDKFDNKNYVTGYFVEL